MQTEQEVCSANRLYVQTQTISTTTTTTTKHLPFFVLCSDDFINEISLECGNIRLDALHTFNIDQPIKQKIGKWFDLNHLKTLCVWFN